MHTFVHVPKQMHPPYSQYKYICTSPHEQSTILQLHAMYALEINYKTQSCSVAEAALKILVGGPGGQRFEFKVDGSFENSARIPFDVVSTTHSRTLSMSSLEKSMSS